MDTSRVTALHIMTRHLAVTIPDGHFMDAVERLIAHRVSGLPVVDTDGRFMGRFTEQTAIAALDLAHIRPNSFLSERLRKVVAQDFMKRSGLVLDADRDVFECAGELLTHKVSGAPVVDRDGGLLGVFSEQSIMHVFIGLCWEQLPSSVVTAWLDRDERRRISKTTGLDEILRRFQTTPYRRLMVLDGPTLIGQITRRDALQAVLEHTRRPLFEYHPGSSADHQNTHRTDVASWMERHTHGTHAEADVLSIARQFLHTSARQIPVLDGMRLEGQISRCDLVRAIQAFFPIESTRGEDLPTLYLSSINKHDARSVMK